MFNDVMTEVVNLRTFVFVYLIIATVIITVLFIFTRKFTYNNLNLKVFTLFLGLNSRQITAIALAISRYIFVVLSAVFYKNVSVGTFIVLMILTLIIMIVTRDFLSVVTGLLNYTAIYAICYLEAVLFNFYMQVENYWAVLVMAIILALFVVLYSTYHLFYTYNRIIKKPGKDIKWRLPKLKVKPKQKPKQE